MNPNSVTITDIAASKNTAAPNHANAIAKVIGQVSASVLLGLEAFATEATNPAAFVTSGALSGFLASFLTIWIPVQPVAQPTPTPATLGPVAVPDETAVAA